MKAKKKPVKEKIVRLVVAVPFTGLGLYGGFRGNRWLRNRIDIFKKFTLQSLLAQTDQDFVLWLQWRCEERGNKHVVDLENYLRTLPVKFVFTYGGVCMYDDKYSLDEAKIRLSEALYKSLPNLFDVLPDCDEVIHLLQPSDDCYDRKVIELTKKVFSENEIGALSFHKGYLCNYNTKEVLEYNPQTNPPFAAIRFTRDQFFNHIEHMKHISLKTQIDEKYPVGTPLPSHEYLPYCLTTAYFDWRGFLVGTHGENISTHFNHPYGGEKVEVLILEEFGILGTPKLDLPISFRKWLMRRLPHKVQRKLRYWFGEKLWARYYSWIRN
jgi:hypothetical protein